MKHLGVCGCAVLLLMLLLLPASAGYAAEREFTADAVYKMLAGETKTQAEETVRKLALRHAAEQAAVYIIERSEYDRGFTSEDEIYALAGQVLKLKQAAYDWQADNDTGVLTVNATIVAVLDEKTVDAKLLEMVHEHQLSERLSSEARESADDGTRLEENDEEIALLIEMDKQHHFTAKQWFRQAQSLFQMESYAAAIYACERTMEMEPNHSQASHMWVQAHKNLGKAAASAGHDSRGK